MSRALAISRLIDALNERVGRAVSRLVLVCVAVSATNAVVRKAFDISSNGWLELQWYLFSAVFLLAAGYTLLHNEHVRIDVIAGRLSGRRRAWIDIFGTIFFLLPLVLLAVGLSLPVVLDKFVHGETSVNAGGLILWPVWLLIPVGFFLLGLQGLSELIKRIAFLAGHGSEPPAPAPVPLTPIQDP
jgi:TRAP-type mannitol/chloroaromatic compound transport system permease small subunit